MSIQRRIWRRCFAVAWCLSLLLAHTAAAADLQRAPLDNVFRAKLEQLADKCDEVGLPEQARQTREWLIDRGSQRQYAFIPLEADPLKPPAGANDLVAHWYKHLTNHRQEYAEQLFALAKSCSKANQSARAYRLLHEVLRENPDHQAARTVLGYSQQLGRWRRAGWRSTARTVRVAHPLFGWAGGRYWRVETAHFHITTNHSIKGGQELGRRLEDLYDIWSQLFFGFWGDPLELASRIENKKPPRFNLAKKHRVVLFRDRQQYVQQLGKFIKGIDVTEGIYIDSRSTSYFCAGDERAVSNWYHEATHQLFHESRPAADGVGLKDNFWIIEGIAMYMESLTPRLGYWTIGGFDAPRLQYARYRALNQKFYVPLKELTAMGRDDVQKDPRLRRLYSQSAGLAQFLMDYDDGTYRQVTIDWLCLLYAGRENRNSLVELSGANYEELDQQYRQFLNVTDEQIEKYFNPSDEITSLLLGHTAITDKSLSRIVKCANLESLDLAFTKTTDEGVRHLSAATKLDRLNLEGTQITSAALETVAGLVKLEYLDLSQTKITDAGLAKIAGLTNLSALWLTGTPITDAGLQHLAGLRKLETLDVNDTNVTATAYTQLKKTLPSLKD